MSRTVRRARNRVAAARRGVSAWQRGRRESDRPAPEVSILLVSYNGRSHLRRLLRSLAMTVDVDYELVVVDNASSWSTRLVLQGATLRGQVNSLTLLDRNTLFAPGVNTAHAVSDQRSKYVLLLNPDVVVKDPTWLRRLVDSHERGASSLGYVEGGPWPRADGYCLLIDRDVLVESGGLSQDFHWWWSVTKLQADLLRAGHSVRAVREHERELHHVGGGSGAPPLSARGMQTDVEVIQGWFDGRAVTVVDRL